MKWISVSDRLPIPGDYVLFTDSVEVFYGWLETYEECETPVFYSCHIPFHTGWPENITHWVPLPLPPEVLECVKE